ncbi:PKD domain-containing protein [Chitinophagaceae bacterium MMS25-I14]
MNIFTRPYFLLYAIVLLMLAGPVYGQTPVAHFSASDTVGCAPNMVVSFTNTSTGTTAGTTYSWDLGNGNTSTLQNPGATYSPTNPNAPTYYNVTLTVTNPNGQTSTFTLQLTAYMSPTVSFTAADTAGCSPFTTTFTSNILWNAPGSGTYQWVFSNGGTSTSANPTYTFQPAGYYGVVLKATNGAGCQTTLQVPQYIHARPQPVPSYLANPTGICNAPGSAVFTNTSTGSGPFTTSWDFGDGGTGSGSPTPHTYTNNGNYTINMIVTDVYGCKDTINTPNGMVVAPLQADFTAHPEACVGEHLDFINTTTPSATSYRWDFGDGTQPVTATNPNHTYYTAGTYNVQLIANNNGCADTVYHTVVVHPKPTIAFNYLPNIPCPPPSTIQFNNTTTNAVSYTWYFGDGVGTSTFGNPSYTYTNPGYFDITLVAVSAFGCKDSVVKPAYVAIDGFNINMQGNFAGCIPLTVNFSVSATSYPSPIVGYNWNFGDGSPNSTLAAPAHIYTAYGTYTVTLTLTAANGCTKVLTQLIRAGTPPTANFVAQPLVACVNEVVHFTDSSLNVSNWYWNFGDNNISSAPSPDHQYSLPGTYTVMLKVLNNGCPDSMIRTNYIKVNFPKALAQRTYNCNSPLNVSFHNNSLDYNGWTWYFGDGTSTSTVLHPVHTYPATGSYTAMLVCWNDTTGCHDTAVISVNVIQLVPTFAANDTAICRDGSVNFTSAVSGGTVVAYDWSVDGLTFLDTTANFQFVFHITGYHSVSLTVHDNNNCTTTLTKTNYIIVGWPTPVFSASPQTVCAPGTVLFTDQTSVVPGTTIVTRIWDLGFGPQPNNPNLTTTQSYTAAGSYSVKLVLTDNIGCTDSVLAADYIKVRKPVANFSATATTSCPGRPITFLNNSQGASLDYTWYFGDGTTSTATSPQHSYSQTGTYTVKLVIHDGVAGCKDSITKVDYITIVNKPTAGFTLSDTFKICSPLVVSTSNSSAGATSYLWQFGDGGTSPFATPTHVYQPGIFNVLLIATNQYGCSDTAKSRVRVLGYAGELSYSPLSGCAPLTVNFTALEHNVPGFVYDFADGTILATTSLTATHTYLHAGPYVPALIMTDNAGCSATSMGLDTIKADGVYGGFTYSPYPACDKGTLQFLDTSRAAYSTISTRYWIFHDGQTSTAANPSHSYPGTGTYNITLIHNTTTGCRDTLDTSVTFYPLPVIDAGPDTTICVGDAAILNPSGGTSYIWTPIATLSCDSCTHPLASPTAPTLYTVKGTDVHGCSSTDTVHVYTKTKVDALVGNGGEICESDTFRLSVTGAGQYLWLPPYGLNDNTIQNPLASPDTTVRYMVVSSQGSCIADTGYVTVTVHPRPHVNAGPDQTIIAGNTTQLNALGNSIVKYAWTPAVTLSCSDCQDPEATPVGTTVYTVKAYTDYGCTDSDDVRINVICQQSQLYIPNTFTPNQDGQNDRFYPRGKGIRIIKSFKIYNRWGEVIFEKSSIDVNDFNNGWDGTYKGKTLPPDVFVYTIDGTCDTGEEFSWQGDISLIR